MTALTLIGYQLYKWDMKLRLQIKRMEWRKKRKLQCASEEHKEIADRENADAVCQTDDGWLNDLKGDTIQNLEKDVKKRLSQLIDEKQQLECKVKEL